MVSLMLTSQTKSLGLPPSFRNSKLPIVYEKASVNQYQQIKRQRKEQLLKIAREKQEEKIRQIVGYFLMKGGNIFLKDFYSGRY